MKKKFILGLLTTILVSFFTASFAYNSDDLNKRLLACTPTKDYEAGGSTLYQISGLTGNICIFKIQNVGISNKPDLICKVPFSRMREMTSYNPVTVQNIKNKYCVISIKSLNKPRNIYY